MTTPPPLDEQAVKRAAIALLDDIHQGWGSLAPQWRAPDTLIFRTGSSPCEIVTTANVGPGWADGPEAERLLPALNRVLQRHGFPPVPAVDYRNGQAVLASTHPDGRVVTLRGRSGDLEVSTPAPGARCDASPRRI